MSGLVWIERHVDRDANRFFAAVILNGRFVKSFWNRADALKEARRQADLHGARLREAKVLTFRKGGAQ
ncbi:hypothetical protein [Gemmobacter sp. LW-1]|uniref:hypothetical protein n=1 Tax=Gemmobacter sp. LW-1 TaxID=1529005 RepID=UPI0006C745A5|nr:hypothetical protein [Gemmobacter sp. LW-1]